MKQDDNTSLDYIQKTEGEVRAFVQQLLIENEKLRKAVAHIENELASKSELVERAEQVSSQDKNLQWIVSLLEEQVENLKKKNIEITAEAARYRRQLSILEEKLSTIETENRKFSDKYQMIESHSHNLATLYVTAYRLHSTLDRQQVLSTINETLINLIGTEDFAVFEIDEEAAVLNPVSSFGIEDDELKTIQIGSGPIGAAFARGQTIWETRGGDEGTSGIERKPRIFVPMKLGEKITGGIAVFSLLPQKSGLEEIDREIFNLLATHAATALYCTKIHMLKNERRRVA